MLERLQELPAGVTGVVAKFLVTKDDYQEVVHPIFEEARAEGRRVRFLYEFGPSFVDFTAGGMWQDAQLGTQYLRLLERCAVITELDWLRKSVEIASTMMPCLVRVFAPTERDAAIAWLAAPATTSVAHRLIPSMSVLVVEPEAALKREDFDDLAALVDPWIESHGMLSGVVIRVRTFPGWKTLGAMLRHVRFVQNHHRKVRRVALVSDTALAELASHLAEHFVAADVRHFAYASLDDAIQWASTTSAPAAPSSPRA